MQIDNLTAADIRKMESPEMPRGDRWIVIAYDRRYYSWKQPSEASGLWECESNAEKAAADLSSYWGTRLVVKIPGESQ